MNGAKWCRHGEGLEERYGRKPPGRYVFCALFKQNLLQTGITRITAAAII